MNTNTIFTFLLPNGVIIRETTADDTISASHHNAVPGTSGYSVAEVVFGSNVVKILSGAFLNCTNLTHITFLPRTTTAVLVVEAQAFQGCTALKQVHNLHLTGITVFLTATFRNCSALTSISIPASLTQFGGGVFEGCTSLSRIIYEDATELDAVSNNIFLGLTQQVHVTYYNTLSELDIVDRTDNPDISPRFHSAPANAVKTYIQYNETRIIYTNGSDTPLTEANLSIDSGTYANNTTIKHLYIGTNVTSIAASAFSGCTGLTSVHGIYFKSNATPFLGLTNFVGGASMLSGCSALEYVAIPVNMPAIPASAFVGCTALKEMYIPEGITSMGNSALSVAASNFTCLALPATMASFGTSAFQSSYIRHADLYNTQLTSIPTSCFQSAQLQYVSFPLTLGVLGTSSFQFSFLKRVRIPGTVYSIGTSCFATNTNLIECVFEDNMNASIVYGQNILSGCNLLERVVNLPETMTTIPVGFMQFCAAAKLYDKYGTETTQLPRNITSIGNNSLRGCVAAFAGKTVRIPPNVTSIGLNAFSGSVDVFNNSTIIFDKANAITVIGNNNSLGLSASTTLIFYGVANAAELPVTSGILFTEITGWDASMRIYRPTFGAEFTYSDGTSSVVVGPTISSASYTVPVDHTLTSVAIGSAITSISDGTFSGQTSLSNVVFSQSVVTSIPANCFNGCAALARIAALPSGITSIGASAFNASGLKEVRIPASVGSIGANAFASCTGLKTLVYESAYNNPVTVNSTALDETPTDLTIIYNNAVDDTDLTAALQAQQALMGGAVKFWYNVNGVVLFLQSPAARISIPINEIASRVLTNAILTPGFGASTLTKIGIGTGLLSIDADTFADITTLTSVVNAISSPTTPPLLATIGNRAFKNCRLTNINFLPETNVRVLNAEVFAGNTTLTAAPLASTRITSIGANAFTGDSALSIVTLPSTLTAIGDECFKGCSTLGSIAIPNNVTTVPVACFQGCGGLTTIDIPNAVTTIGAGCFKGCSTLGSIAIPTNVTALPDACFQECTMLSALPTATNVTSYGADCFQDCAGLTTLNIPNTVTTIGNACFQYCVNITSAVISNNVTTLPDACFRSCARLLDLPTAVNVTSYGVECFRDCDLLTTIDIPNAVTTLGDYCFYESGITSVTISDNITELPLACFYECPSLVSLPIAQNVTSYGTSCFSGCTAMTSITIPDVVTTIGASCFYGCTLLASAIISTNVTELGINCFRDCTALTDLPVAQNVTSYGESCFSGCTDMTSITIPDVVTTIGDECFQGCNYLAFVAFNDAQIIAVVGANSFADTAADIAVTYRNAVDASDLPPVLQPPLSGVSVGAEYTYFVDGVVLFYSDAPTRVAVADITTIQSTTDIRGAILQKVGVGEAITHIASEAFLNRASLESVVFVGAAGVSVVEMGDACFQGCTGLTVMTIPDSVALLGDSCFQGCTGITAITIPDAVALLGDSCFQGCTGITAITIPDAVTLLGDSCFQGCVALSTLPMAVNVTAYGDSCFQGCESLGAIVIPTTVATIGAACFQGCVGLTAATISATIATIPTDAFQNCGALSTVVFATNASTSALRVIGERAFRGCASLGSISVPNAVTEIGVDAFRSTGLVSFAFPLNIETIGDTVLAENTQLTDIYFRDSRGLPTIGVDMTRDTASLARVTYKRALPASFSGISTVYQQHQANITANLSQNQVTFIYEEDKQDTFIALEDIRDGFRFYNTGKYPTWNIAGVSKTATSATNIELATDVAVKDRTRDIFFSNIAQNVFGSGEAVALFSNLGELSDTWGELVNDIIPEFNSADTTPVRTSGFVGALLSNAATAPRFFMTYNAETVGTAANGPYFGCTIAGTTSKVLAVGETSVGIGATGVIDDIDIIVTRAT